MDLYRLILENKKKIKEQAVFDKSLFRKCFVVLLFVLFIPSMYSYASEAKKRQMKKDDMQMYFAKGDTQMYLGNGVNRETYDTVTDESKEIQIVELSNWEHKPHIVESVFGKGKIRIRNEKDFLIIWYKSQVALFDNDDQPLDDIIRLATEAILPDKYVLGEADTLTGKGLAAAPKSKFHLSLGPKRIPGKKTHAIICGYYGTFNNENWGPILTAYVIVKGKNAVIVLEKAKARTYPPSYIYDGLAAAKKRLSKEKAEKFKQKPVMGADVIFDPDDEVTSIPDVLLNGCIWEIQDAKITGAKKIGYAKEWRRRSSKKAVKGKETTP